MPRPFKKVTTDLMLRIANNRDKYPNLTLAQRAELFGVSVTGMSKILKRLREKA